jgi:hypothetical protein
MDSKVKDLNLLLLYLTSWQEASRKEPGEMLYRSWKGYLFEVLNELESENMIVQYNNSHKSVYLTKEGVAKAEKLKEKYF